MTLYFVPAQSNTEEPVLSGYQKLHALVHISDNLKQIVPNY